MEIVKSLDQKEQAVRDHYESVYKIKLRTLLPEEILDLYKKLQKLRDSQFFYEKKRAEMNNGNDR